MNVIFILGFKSPGKALEKKTVKHPWKTLEFLISEDVPTLCSTFTPYNSEIKYHILTNKLSLKGIDTCMENISSKQEE